MGQIILKMRPADDLYMIWSTVVESPVFLGDRADVVAYLEAERFMWSDPEGALARADACGASSKLWRDGAWDDPECVFIYEQRGILRARKLPILAEMFLLDPAADAGPLLEPFDDEESVRPR